MEKRKFNIIDFILIVFIVAVAAVLVYVMLGNTLFGGSQDAIILYTIQIDLLKNEFIPAINKIVSGTEVTDSVRLQGLGRVHSVEIDDAYANETDLVTGVVRRVSFPDHSRVTISVIAECRKEDDFKFIVNGKTVMVGIPVHFRTPYFVSYGMCVYIEELTGGSISGEE
jgi:hypothetical protein